MTRDEAKAFVLRNHYVDVDDNDYCALVGIRHHSEVLPDYAIDGALRDEAEWAFIDMAYKQDTNAYGAVYYIRANEPDYPKHDYDDCGEAF